MQNHAIITLFFNCACMRVLGISDSLQPLSESCLWLPWIYVFCNSVGQFDLVPLVGGLEARFEFITLLGRKALIRTDYNAPMFKLILIDLDNPGKVLRYQQLYRKTVDNSAEVSEMPTLLWHDHKATPDR